MPEPTFTHIQSVTLNYNGECSLLGVDRDDKIYVEERYTNDYWGAQHIISADGDFLHTEDDDYGHNQAVTPVPVPADAAKPHPGWHTNKLNFSGPRHRGLREHERVAETVKSLPMPLKMRVVERLNLDIMPPLLLGLAESYVMSEVELIRPHTYLVCRRLRFAYALQATQKDANGQPYDYDTTVLHIAHVHQRGEDGLEELATGLDSFAGITLNHPMDCITREDRLYMADSGLEQAANRVHIWQINHRSEDDDTV